MDDRAVWLEERRRGLGSSDMAAVLGLAPFGLTPLHVWLDKLGRLPAWHSPQAQWGLKKEEAIALAYEEATGLPLLKPPTRIVWHPSIPWMFASVDREVRRPGAEGGRVVELKSASYLQRDEWGEPYTDQIPEAYLPQVQHQMEVFGYDLADVPVLIDQGDFRIYRVHKNPDLVAQIVAAGEAFWRLVATQTPPAADWSDPHYRAVIGLLHRPQAEVTVQLPPLAEVAVQEYEHLGEQMAALKDDRDRAQAQIIAMMGSAGVGILPDGREVRRKEIQIREQKPREYTRTDFRICKPSARRRS